MKIAKYLIKFAIFGILLIGMPYTTSANTINVRIWGQGVLDPDTLIINTGDEVVWTAEGGSGHGYTLISTDGIFEPRYLKENTTSYVFNKTGRY